MKMIRLFPLAGLLLVLLLGQSAAEAQTGFSDSFHSSSLDDTLWGVSIQGIGSVDPQTDGLHMTLTADNSGPLFRLDVWSRSKVQGDFDAQVEYRLSTWPPANGARLGLGAWRSAAPPDFMGRWSEAGGPELYVTLMADGGHGTETTNSAGRLRLTRTGDTLTGYFYSSGSWVLLHSDTDPQYTADAVISLSMWGHNSTPGVEVILENFSVTADGLTSLDPFTPTYSHTADEIAASDPYVIPTDDECLVGAPCKTLYAEDIPDGQPGASIFLLLPSSIVNFAGDQIVPDGAIVGRVYGSVRQTDQVGMGLCPSTGTVEPYDFLWYEGTIDPGTTTGSQTDLYSSFHWPTQLDGFRGAILAANPGAVLHSRWVKQTEGWSVNVLQFKLPDGGMLIVPDIQTPGQEVCGPTEIRSIYLGLSGDNLATPQDEGGIPLFTCSVPGTQTYRLSLDRDDTPPGDPVVLEDTITCSPNTAAGDDVSVPLNGGTEALAGIDITFSEVTDEGSTTVVTTTAGPPPPTGFKIIGLAGVPLYFDINTDTSYSGDLTVCVRYDETQVAGQEANLKLMQRVDGFVDITTSVDTANDIICGTTTGFSIFVVAEPLAGPPVVGGMVEMQVGSSGLGVASVADASGAASGSNYIAIAGLAAAAVVALSAGAWYTRRRWVR